MPEDEKRANEGLAALLFNDVMGGKPGRTLDVGASYPYLASRLKARGCTAWAMDGDQIQHDLDVVTLHANFEEWDGFEDTGYRAALVSFVHSFEHVYDPLAAFRKLRGLVAEDGALFIRMPDNQVEGIERDLTPGHYLIHPFVHALSSIAELCARTGNFVIERATPLRPGQRDLVLRPI